MSQYVNEEYYLNSFGGKMLTNDVDKFLELAQIKIDDVTYNRIVHIGFEKLTDFQKECVQKAICYQAEYYYENGINSLTDLSSYSVLDITVNVDNNHKTEAQKIGMDEYAYLTIKKSGLTSRLLKWR